MLHSLASVHVFQQALLFACVEARHLAGLNGGSELQVASSMQSRVHKPSTQSEVYPSAVAQSATVLQVGTQRLMVAGGV